MSLRLATIFLALVTTISFAAAESGICSWYTAHKGARTANGEVFNPNALTAAHKTLPFNSHVRVHIGNHAIVVRINDRGPFVAGRILDLTPAGADRLKIRQQGLAKCHIEKV